MASVCVHGLGYVGLPTAALLANNGHDVSGFDVDDTVVEDLARGEVRVSEPDLAAYIEDALAAGTLAPSHEVVPADYHLVCVPTPLDHDAGRADLSYVEAAAEGIAAVLREGDTVILESTVPPGTTGGPMREALERTGLVAGEDFHLAYSPETVLPGNILEELRSNDRFVGGLDETSTERAYDLYAPCIDGTVGRAPTPRSAEFVKLVQNAYRDANIGFANELARIAGDYGVDAREAIDLANRHSRVDILDPGPGVGGHCLPVDPLFLAHDSDSVRLIREARRVNDGMADYVVGLVEGRLGTLDDRRVAVLGVAYKGNVDDVRNSPGLRVARAIHDREVEPTVRAVPDGGVSTAEVRLNDPHVDDGRHEFDLVSVEGALTGADAMVVTADHDEYRDVDPVAAKRWMRTPLLVVTKGMLDEEEWRAAGFDVVGL
ncbi:nucleotide sugar dehydrogenase [Halomarina litorea]|uniref:nucleotide sugar dehydrogenase n=1 Tax=Halomarina litorea TaxID=2961595 RepID=UPI0020C4F410|nr:nucleotide sugar dehydrogenase [Halomarina sp. BCD28]